MQLSACVDISSGKYSKSPQINQITVHLYDDVKAYFS